MADRGTIFAGLACLLGACSLVLQSGCGSDHSPTSAVSRQTESQAASPRAVDGQRSDAQRARPTIDRDQEIDAVDQLLVRGDVQAAEAKLKNLLVRDPNDAEVTFRLASVVAQRGDLSAAIKLLDSIPTDHPDAGLPALGQSADWCFKLQRYREAERRYQRILELIPGAPEAHRKLAYLYNRQGRRHEAAAHIYLLCQQGNVHQDELHALIQLSDAMYASPSESHRDDQERPYWPIGPEAEARRLFMEQEVSTSCRGAAAVGGQR